MKNYLWIVPLAALLGGCHVDQCNEEGNSAVWLVGIPILTMQSEACISNKTPQGATTKEENDDE